MGRSCAVPGLRGPGGRLPFSVTFAAHDAIIDGAGATPRDGTALAAGRDFMNLRMYGRAAATSDPGQFSIWPHPPGMA